MKAKIIAGKLLEDDDFDPKEQALDWLTPDPQPAQDFVRGSYSYPWVDQIGNRFMFQSEGWCGHFSNLELARPGDVYTAAALIEAMMRKLKGWGASHISFNLVSVHDCDVNRDIELAVDMLEQRHKLRYERSSGAVAYYRIL